MDSFKAFEAATLQAGIGAPPTDTIDNDDDGGDDDQWEFENIRKRFWDGLLPWVRTNPAANVVRFNIYENMIRKVRPKARSSIWGPQGDVQARKIVKARQGYARAVLEWPMEMEGMQWDKLVEQQRPVLTKSDMYKAFGKEGQVGSAALLFKGDVLECMVYLCCAITPMPVQQDTRQYTVGMKADPFTTNIIKLAQSKLGGKIESWLRERIVSKLRPALITGNVRGNDLTLPNLKLTPYNTSGKVQAYTGSLILQLDQGFRMNW